MTLSRRGLFTGVGLSTSRRQLFSTPLPSAPRAPSTLPLCIFQLERPSDIAYLSSRHNHAAPKVSLFISTSVRDLVLSIDNRCPFINPRNLRGCGRDFHATRTNLCRIFFLWYGARPCLSRQRKCHSISVSFPF